MRAVLAKIRNTLAPPASLPAAARMERLSDRRGLPAVDPGPHAVVKACTAWLCAAQDHSSSHDGGVKGSFPVDGDYGAWAYLNWAAKFCIDANLLELELAREAGDA